MVINRYEQQFKCMTYQHKCLKRTFLGIELPPSLAFPTVGMPPLQGKLLQSQQQSQLQSTIHAYMAGTRCRRPPEDSSESSTSDAFNNVQRTTMNNCITKKVRTISFDANNDQDASPTPQTVKNDKAHPSAPTTNSTLASHQQLLQLMKAALATASEAVAATPETSFQDFEETVSIAECLLNTLKTASQHTTHADNSTVPVQSASTTTTSTPQTYVHVAAFSA
jgi:hypothetical protein